MVRGIERSHRAGRAYTNNEMKFYVSVHIGGKHPNRKLLAVNETTFTGNETIFEIITEKTTLTTPALIVESTTVTEPIRQSKNCTQAAILEFPSDGFSRNQRKHGWIAVHILIACYCFWLLAIVCDDYFVPAIGIMCFSK